MFEARNSRNCVESGRNLSEGGFLRKQIVRIYCNSRLFCGYSHGKDFEVDAKSSRDRDLDCGIPFPARCAFVVTSSRGKKVLAI